ncbi:MAG: RluA family pseudouridine synthase [Candidatus Moranbacteria bacterium]|nr:RluA family pseudouridine synthase [Candidatus Moranbacteria bacterium]
MKIKDRITIEKNDADQRLDKFLVSWIEKKEGVVDDFSRGDLIRAVKKQQILINGKKTKPSHILKEGEVVSVEIEKVSDAVLPNEKIELNVVYEDEDIIVIDKQAGLCVHPSNSNDDSTLVSGLVVLYPEIVGVGDDSFQSNLRPGIVHRLDRDTSGVMIVARNQKAFDELKRKFQSREIQKTYQTIVFGHLEKKKIIVSSPIAKATNYKRQVIATKKTKTKTRDAVTEFNVIKEYDKYSVVEAKPKTGRMHQIRVHLLSVGNPIVGDKLYKKKEFLTEEFLGSKRQLLHACEIEFELFGKAHKFSSQIPFDFVEFLELIKN